METSDCNQEEGKNWGELSSDVLELIFSSLPVKSVLRSATVCKRWYSVVGNPLFADFYRKNQNHGNSCIKLVYRGTGFNSPFSVHFDSLEGIRCQPAKEGCNEGCNVPTVPCFGYDVVPTIQAAGGQNLAGLYLAVTETGETTLNYKLSLVEQKWRRTPPIPIILQDPVVGVVHGEDGRGHKLVVAGGSTLYSEDGSDLCVWIFDRQTESWGHCDALPCQFRGCTSSLFMSAVVHKGRFYVYDMYSGLVSLLDLETKRWSPVVKLRSATQWTQLFLVSQSNGLCLVGAQEASESGISFTVWNVMDDFEETVRVGEILHKRVIMNACGPPPSPIPGWASSSVKVASSASTFLSNCFGVLLLLFVKLVIVNFAVTRRSVHFLRGLITSIATIVRIKNFRNCLEEDSRRGLDRYPVVAARA